MVARLCIVLLFLLGGPTAMAAGDLTYGPFGKIAIYTPAGPPTSVVLFFSGDGHWNRGVVDMAQALAEHGALVAGIDTVHFLHELEKSTAQCAYPAADVERLSHYLQKKYALPQYLTPVLAGYSSGATLVYALLAAAPAGTFRGGMSLGFCPDLALHKPLCPGYGLASKRRRDGRGLDLVANTALQAPWIALQGTIDQVCNPQATAAFVDHIPAAKLVMLPKVGHGYSVPRNWMPQYRAAFDRLTKTEPNAAVVPGLPADLPITELPAHGNGDTMAVMVSGDGGWAGLDKAVGEQLARQGIPVAGLSSLKYFWTPRSPAGAAADLDRIIAAYLRKWHKQRVILIGYSLGADVLPFMINRLPAATRERVVLVALLGLGEQAQFEFHLTDWLGGQPHGTAVRPELERLHGAPVLCIYGRDEKHSLCPALPATRVTAIKRSGGHHFGGDYDALVRLILGKLPAAPS